MTAKQTNKLPYTWLW